MNSTMHRSTSRIPRVTAYKPPVVRPARAWARPRGSPQIEQHARLRPGHRHGVSIDDVLITTATPPRWAEHRDDLREARATGHRRHARSGPQERELIRNAIETGAPAELGAYRHVGDRAWSQPRSRGRPKHALRWRRRNSDNAYTRV